MSDILAVQLSNTMDATVWAKGFVDTLAEHPDITDEDCMQGWFANAIMKGWDAATSRADTHSVLALGWLSSELAKRADAANGNAPAWFPQPPEWLTLWEEALRETWDDVVRIEEEKGTGLLRRQSDESE